MMRQKIIILLILILILIKGSYAQDKGFTFLLGPAVNYYHGDTNEKFSYSSEKLSWQFNGQFGFISTRGGTTRGNMLAIFGTAGSTNPAVIQQMQTDGAHITGLIDTEKKFNEFYCVEGGMVIARFLRLSGGFGRQSYSNLLGENYKLKYFSGTLGLVSTSMLLTG
ncbi:MAG: hypothetical protein IPF54_25665 [Draconibacterium sp.]|nr:hypothetical protein [Draconibacterium sp.]